MWCSSHQHLSERPLERHSWIRFIHSSSVRLGCLFVICIINSCFEIWSGISTDPKRIEVKWS